jgi:hypothetical protein
MVSKKDVQILYLTHDYVPLVLRAGLCQSFCTDTSSDLKCHIIFPYYMFIDVVYLHRNNSQNKQIKEHKIKKIDE